MLVCFLCYLFAIFCFLGAVGRALLPLFLICIFFTLGCIVVFAGHGFWCLFLWDGIFFLLYLLRWWWMWCGRCPCICVRTLIFHPIRPSLLQVSFRCRQLGWRQVVFVDEFAMWCLAVDAYSYDFVSGLLEGWIVVADTACLGCASWCAVFGVEIKD